MPIKHALWRQGLIGSPECRLPLTQISPELADDLEPALREDEPARTAVPYAARGH